MKQITVSELLNRLEEMKLIKEHSGHKRGEVKLVACPRCTYNELKIKWLGEDGE